MGRSPLGGGIIAHCASSPCRVLSLHPVHPRSRNAAGGLLRPSPRRLALRRPQADRDRPVGEVRPLAGAVPTISADRFTAESAENAERKVEDLTYRSPVRERDPQNALGGLRALCGVRAAHALGLTALALAESAE